jgi:EAL domain-containing protein (putative c-di-GMP-specific phosphodiesterase class I)
MYLAFVRCKKCFQPIWFSASSESMPTQAPWIWGNNPQNLACLACNYVCEYRSNDSNWEQDDSPGALSRKGFTAHLFSMPCSEEGCRSTVEVTAVTNGVRVLSGSMSIAENLFARNIKCGTGHRNVGPVINLSSVVFYELEGFGSRAPDIYIDNQELRKALRRNEFVLHYQPQIDLKTGSVIGLEAFARWNHPQRGLVFPDCFIVGMSTFGLFKEFDHLIVDRGLFELKRFENRAAGMLRLTLKVSTESLCDIGFPDALAAMIKKHGVPATKIAFDVPGARILHKNTADVLAQLGRNKVQISIDDYGTGRVGIQQLREISAAEIRIDKSYIQKILESQRDRLRVEQTILLAHELGMRVLAEGVETREQAAFLRLKDCDYAQGYLFCDPLHPERMLEWLKTYRPQSPSRC